MQIPVFLFTGFLDGGKTTLIKHLLAQGRLCTPGEPTLILLCETGLETFPPAFRAQYHLHCAVLRTQEEMAPQRLEALRLQHGCTGVIIELNGFWPSARVEQALPEHWRVREKICAANAQTIQLFAANLKGQTADKIAYASLVVLNRVSLDADTAAYHKLVRTYGRRARIFFVSPDGIWREDETEEETPYPLDAAVIEIPDFAFAIWMHDLLRSPVRYIGRTMRVRGQLMRDGTVAVFGRTVTAGRIQDAEFWGLTAAGAQQITLDEKSWYLITAQVLAGDGTDHEPGLHILEASPTYPPAQLLAFLL